jgi:F-type H+-transporting ATPase subunit a
MATVTETPQEQLPKPPSKTKLILYSILAIWLGGTILFAIAFGTKAHKAKDVASEVFSPTNEFKLDTWFKAGPVPFNKGVLYLLLTVGITAAIMIYVARRLQQRPGRLQVAVEMFYNLCQSMSRENMDESMAKKYFPLIATIFVFILVTNMIGYVPLPVNSVDKFKAFGTHIPSFQLYAADTNVGLPLLLALGVFTLFTYEGVRAHHGPLGYIRSLMPGGLEGPIKGLVFPIEILSNFLRLISLTVRLWANLLAGHLLIAFMGGELGVLVGLQFIQWFLLPIGVAIYLFEAVLIAGLQAFIFAILTAIYLGSAVESH